MATQPAIGFITPEQYLEQERKAEFKSEYLNGEVFPMPGVSLNHSRIVGNVIFELKLALRDLPFEILTSDLRLEVPATGLFTYPDITVVSGDPKLRDAVQDTLMNPCLIVEVLSPSTQDYDRGTKFNHYRNIPSVQDYLTVAQSKIHVEHRQRQSDNRWLFIDHEADSQTLKLESIGVELNISRFYDKVTF